MGGRAWGWRRCPSQMTLGPGARAPHPGHPGLPSPVLRAPCRVGSPLKDGALTGPGVRTSPSGPDLLEALVPPPHWAPRTTSSAPSSPCTADSHSQVPLAFLGTFNRGGLQPAIRICKPRAAQRGTLGPRIATPFALWCKGSGQCPESALSGAKDQVSAQKVTKCVSLKTTVHGMHDLAVPHPSA